MTAAPATPRSGVGRRAVLAAGAWATPVVAAGLAAPWAAASTCPPVTYALDWNLGATTTFSRSSATSATAVATPAAGGGLPITVTLTSAFTSLMTPYSNIAIPVDNLDVTAYNVGGTGQHGLALAQYIRRIGFYSASRSYRQTLTIGFGVPVDGLSFTITDIDSNPGQFWDAVELTSAAAFTATRAATVTGAGTTASPWHSISATTPQDDQASALGNVGIVFTAPVSSLTLTYWNMQSNITVGDAPQAVYLSRFSFTYAADTC